MAPDQRLKLPRLRWKHGAYHYDHGGTPRRWKRLGTDEAIVRREYDRLEAQRALPAGTVDAMLRDYLDAPRNSLTGEALAIGTVKQYRGYRGHLAAVFGPQHPDELTQADIVKYLRLAKRKTARGEIGLLSLAFTAWMDAGRLTFNPCFGVRVRLPQSRRKRLLSMDELERIVAASDERDRVAWELKYAIGVRIGDLARLRWTDFAESLETQKTGARQAWTITPELRAILDRARALQARVASLYVLCDRRGRPRKPGTLRDHFKAAATRAGVPDAIPHDIRAAAGTEVARQHGMRAAQLFLGHKREATTEVYVRDRLGNVVTPLARRKA